MRVFAAALAATAGFVDAVGFLITGGYFVSFMSGNSTRLAVDLALGARSGLLAGALIAAFVVGVVLGASLRRASPRRPETSVLVLLTAILIVCGGLAGQGLQLPTTLLLAVAMGAENTVFAEGGDVRFGLTYMTGALVKVGKGLTVALFGGDRFGWAPYLLLWAALVGGAVLGAVTLERIGAAAVWVAAAAFGGLAILSTGMFPRRSSPAPRGPTG